MSDFMKAIKLESILAWLMKFSMSILLLYSLHRHEYTWAFACGFSLLLCAIPNMLKRRFDIHLPTELEFLIVLALFLHSGGGALNAYHAIPGWDHITHFTGTAVVALLGLMIMAIIDGYSEQIRFNTPMLIFFVIIFALAMGTVWEMFEFSSDKIFGTHEQWSLDDTMWDLIFDMIGGIIVAVPGAFYLRFTSPERYGLEIGERIGIGTFLRRKESAQERIKKKIFG